MSPQSRSRSPHAKRLTPLAAALLAIPSSGTVLAQTPPGDDIILVNADRDLVERKTKGEFIARLVFDREIEDLFYAIGDADTGDWITTMYHVKARAKRSSVGWEYSWQYPVLKEQPELDPETPYLVVILASGSGRSGAFHAVIPVHQPSGLWGRVLGGTVMAYRGVSGSAADGDKLLRLGSTNQVVPDRFRNLHVGTKAPSGCHFPVC